MADLDLSLAKDVTLLLSVGGFAIKLWWDDREKRRTKLEDKAEVDATKASDARTDLLGSVLEKVTALERDMSLLLEKHATSIGQVAEVKARIEGISTNHGGRLGTVEQTLVELRTRIVGLEGKRR